MQTMQKRTKRLAVILTLLLMGSAVLAELQLAEDFEDPAMTGDGSDLTGVLGGFFDTQSEGTGNHAVETQAGSRLVQYRGHSSGTSSRGWAIAALSNPIENAETGVVFFRFAMREDGGPAYNWYGFHDFALDNTNPLVGSTDVPDQIVAGFMLRSVQGDPADIDVRTPDEATLLRKVVKGQWYNVWIVADNANDQYDLYMNEAEGPAGPPAASPTGADQLVSGQPFHKATDEALGGIMTFFPGTMPAGYTAQQTARYWTDEIWWDGDQGLRAQTTASSPGPAHDSTDVPRDVVLSWQASAFAAAHNIYFSTSPDDVSNGVASALIGDGITEAHLDVGRLAFDQTYYWRVDEVNRAPDSTVFEGQTWSFEVEPFSIPIANITATASSAHAAEMVAQRTIDGSGLDELDQHSKEATDMWLSGVGDFTPTIQYAFDRAYKLHEMWVWNSNQSIESFVGLGAKEVTIEVSTDANDWTVLENTPEFAQATGQAGYAHNTTIDLGGVIAQYVRLTINAGYGMLPQSGFSEIRFLYIPTFAREPQPVAAETTDTVDVVLNWRAGREAASHEIYLGTDSTDLALVQTTTENSAALSALDYGTTYYWQIVEVNEAEDPGAYADDVWSFSTPAYGTVDDFDEYNDDCNRIFFAWLDGLGHNGSAEIDDCDVAPFNGNGTGSIVGNASSPFAERSIVRSGQSLSLFYDNTGMDTAEAQSDLTPAQDWTAHGIKALSLYFWGDPDNTGQLYVKINNARIDYAGLPDALQRAQWTPWNIDLSTVAGNLQAVTSLTIGVAGAGAAGVVYVDDIRVYPLAPEIITPVEADPANLLAHYAFEGNANDSVGALHGTLVGNAEFVPGQQGQALSLNTVTVTDYVEITGYKGILGASAITIAAWVNTSSDATGAIVGWGPNVAGQRFGFRINAGRLRTEHAGGNVQGDTVMNDGTWHHVAVTVQANATVSYPQVQLWLDGQDNTRRATDTDPPYDIQPDLDVSIGRRPASDDRYFIGQIDQLYIYDRALSPAEIAGLAGLTQPFGKAFSD